MSRQLKAIVPPVVPKRVQPIPLYELSLSKQSMSLVERNETVVDVTSPRSLLFEQQCFTDESARSGTFEKRSLLLSKDQFEKLLACLPDRYQHYQWDVMYDTSVDGYSLQHFLRIMDEPYLSGAAGIGFWLTRSLQQGEWHRRIIGCFTPIVPCEKVIGHHRAGSPETFVFRVVDPELSFDMLEDVNGRIGSFAAKNKGRLCIHHWCGDAAHSRFLSCTSSSISIGGGSQGAALWVDSELRRGSCSHFCETFRCLPLCGIPNYSLPHTEFEVERMIWFTQNLRLSLHSEERWAPESDTL